MRYIDINIFSHNATHFSHIEHAFKSQDMSQTMSRYVSPCHRPFNGNVCFLFFSWWSSSPWWLLPLPVSLTTTATTTTTKGLTTTTITTTTPTDGASAEVSVSAEVLAGSASGPLVSDSEEDTADAITESVNRNHRHRTNRAGQDQRQDRFLCQTAGPNWHRSWI